MTISLSFSLLRRVSSVAAFLTSLIKLTISIKFPTDTRQVEDNLLVLVVEGTGHMVLPRFMRCGSFILTMSFAPVFCYQLFLCSYSKLRSDLFLSVCIYVVCNFFCFWPVYLACRASLTTNAMPLFQWKRGLNTRPAGKSPQCLTGTALHPCIPLLILLSPFSKYPLPVPTK